MAKPSGQNSNPKAVPNPVKTQNKPPAMPTPKSPGFEGRMPIPPVKDGGGK